ncbi:hypothetical protein ACJMK2_017209 [Sinanodonta woodiana]|uniref:Threonine synthase N-terminal domain-containing protein n=1 Tax=Sinanodonta woodiana TaxID=1069815 RepID=A0ABD3UW59_SINWO
MANLIQYYTLKNLYQFCKYGFPHARLLQTNFLAWSTSTVKRRQGIGQVHNRYISSGSIEQANVILMGSPGCGKTTVARILHQKMGMPIIDIDDDHLEPYWGMSVAQKLQEVGSEGFIEAEGRALLDLKASGSIISLTGSNPMHTPAMTAVAQSGTVIFLDVQISDILQRLACMKVSRIVGQEKGTPMEDILQYRQQFYEKFYDIRILCEEYETPESVADKVIQSLAVFKDNKGFVSTRSQGSQDKYKWTFLDVVLQGLAPDGGLFVPAREIPHFSLGEMRRLVHLNYPDRALRILERWINTRDLHPQVLKQFIQMAYDPKVFNCNKIFPVRHLEDNIYLAELFHGPTASFKDAALQLMPLFFTAALQYEKGSQNKKSKYIILVATSGDTGGAVLDGFARHAGNCGVGVMVLYPARGISDIQRLQMTTMKGDNIHVVGVEGDFDLCQTTVKKIFMDPKVEEEMRTKFHCKLSAANSISWGRLVPQIVYHMSAYLDLVQTKVINMGDEVDLCIPTGNFGNILAAFYAKEMGVPFHRLICASNTNNVLTDFISTGVYDLRKRHVLKTSSPSIDILVSSNLERYLYHVTDGSANIVKKCFSSLAEHRHFVVPEEVMRTMQKTMVAGWCSEDQCRNTVNQILNRTGYLLDPHTAVGAHVSMSLNQRDRPLIIASTAHPAKFASDVLAFMGKKSLGLSASQMLVELHELAKLPAPHTKLSSSVSRPVIHSTVCRSNYSNIVSEVYNFLKRL